MQKNVKLCFVGQVEPPPNGNNLIFAPGSNARIAWTFHVMQGQQLSRRTWYFTSTDGTFTTKTIADIDGTEDPKILNSGLIGVTIEENATLVLKNVNRTYDGKYQFILVAGASTGSSTVTVTIVGKSYVSKNQI